MAETTTGAGPVEQGPPSAESVEASLQNAFGDTPAQPRKTQEQPEEAPQEAAPEEATDELTPEDLPEEEKPEVSAAGDEFEIVHNGTQHKLSRAETIKLAQQGFDYTQKTQRVAEVQKQAEAVLQRAAEIEQITPMLAQDMALVKSFEAQLSKYQNVDWVRLATEDPLSYPQHRAQYDQLVQSYQQANQQLNQKAQYVTQARQQLSQQRIAEEAKALVERIPEWKDPAKYQAGARELASYLTAQGVPQEVVQGLDDSLTVSLARKAMLYDRLLAAKNDKSKQLRAAPPVVKPGANPSDGQGRTNFQKAAQQIRQSGRKNDHRTQERIMEAMLGKAFPK